MAEEHAWSPAMIEETDAGHFIHFVLPVEIFTAEKSLPLKLNCKTNCINLPTTWALEVVYENQQDSFQFSLSINLTRIDHSKCSRKVGAFVSLSCLDAKSRLVRFSQELLEVSMNSGDVVQGCTRESRCLLSALKVTLLIKGCHKPKYET